MKKKANRIVVSLLALVLLFSAGCQTEVPAGKTLTATVYDSTNPLTVEQMKQDLAYLKGGLEYYHANAWHSISKADFEAAIAEVESRLEGMTHTQFQYELARLVALIGDAHTSAVLDSRYSNFMRELPFTLKNFDDGWYIFKTDTDHKDFLGWRIDKIGKFRMDQIVEMVKPYFSTETETWTRYKMCGYLSDWDMLFLAGVVDSETVTLTLSKNGKTKKVEYTALPHSECVNLSYTSIDNMDGFTRTGTGKGGENFKYIELKDLLFVQYNVCQNTSTYNMENFVSTLNDVQAIKNYKNLVIDLRYNTGGSSSVIGPLCGFADTFVKAGGNFYLLVGERTFSSGMLAVTSLRQYNPVIVGIPTGGGENHYGNIEKTLELKNSGVNVGCATSWFQVLVDPTVASATPDVVAEHTFEDYFSGIDPELEIVNKLISGEMAKPEPQNVELLAEKLASLINYEEYPWANSINGGFYAYVGRKTLKNWLNSGDERIDPYPMAFAKKFNLTPEELVAVLRLDTASRSLNGRTPEYYTDEDIKRALVWVYGSDQFNEEAVPSIELNVSYTEIWSLYGTEPIENRETLGAVVENAIPWSFIFEIGIKDYLSWANGLSDRSEYTLQNFLNHFELSVFAYDEIFDRLKQAEVSFYSDEKIAEIRTEVYGY